MAVSKRLRYEVLRRDGYACRYCGAKAPHVRLTVDHIVPRTLGGSDLPDNLTAACIDCNAGKSSSNPDDSLVEATAAAAADWNSPSRPYREAVYQLFGVLPTFDDEMERARLTVSFDEGHEDDENEDGQPREYDWPDELKAFYMAVSEVADTHWWPNVLLTILNDELDPAVWRRHLTYARDSCEKAGDPYTLEDIQRYAIVCALREYARFGTYPQGVDD